MGHLSVVWDVANFGMYKHLLWAISVNYYTKKYRCPWNQVYVSKKECCICQIMIIILYLYNYFKGYI